jgi:hypothetical protein
MKKEKRSEKLDPGARKKQKREFLASQLAPEEELTAPLTKTDYAPLAEHDGVEPGEDDYVDGSVILDGDHIKLPRQILSPESLNRGSWLSPVLIFVLTIALSFTAFIAYLISNQPG